MPARSKRLNSFYEFVFDPDVRHEFAARPWEFEGERGPCGHTFRAEWVAANISEEWRSFTIMDVTFICCDFEGTFSSHRMIFKDCKFDLCDFGGTVFRRAKFSKCSFTNSSFTLAEFDDCEFRDCTYRNVYASGNETRLQKTLITEPAKFIIGVDTNVSKLKEGVTEFYQKQRIEDTRSTLARAILATTRSEGSEGIYYEAVKVSTQQECLARISLQRLRLYALTNEGKEEAKDYASIGKLSRFTPRLMLAGAYFDLWALTFFGYMNGWGRSIARPAWIGTVLVLIFGLLYSSQVNLSLTSGLRQSIELFLLFGYTNYADPRSTSGTEFVYLLNALFGIIWYIVTVPTIVNRLTRIRG